jgi:hypothetical protein
MSCIIAIGIGPPSPKRLMTETGAVHVLNSLSASLGVDGLLNNSIATSNPPIQQTLESTITSFEINKLISRAKQFLSSVEVVAKSLTNHTSTAAVLSAEAQVKGHSKALLSVLHDYLKVLNSVPRINATTSKHTGPEKITPLPKQLQKDPSFAEGFRRGAGIAIQRLRMRQQ